MTRYQAVIVALLVVAGIGWILRPDSLLAAWLILLLAAWLILLELAAVRRSRR